MTLRGASILKSADVALYAGSLVNEKILDVCGPGCKKINTAEMSLEDQVATMTEAARAGLKIARLHTGDPSLYGAISEQIFRLKEKNVECEIVPGVSSLQGAAARLGIEYTIPGGTQTLICTRAPGRTPVPETEDIRLLASHRATLVIFLSAGMAGEIVERCLAGGLSGDTPAAWIYRATWEDEKYRVTTLENLQNSMTGEGINNHAIIVIGGCLARDENLRSLLYSPSRCGTSR
jgi:precorrin-4/cobalt-precorrin-4 C11-methyltransferase